MAALTKRLCYSLSPEITTSCTPNPSIEYTPKWELGRQGYYDAQERKTKVIRSEAQRRYPNKIMDNPVNYASCGNSRINDYKRPQQIPNQWK